MPTQTLSKSERLTPFTGRTAGIRVDTSDDLVKVNPDGVERILVDTTTAQTLTNKTLASPAFTGQILAANGSAAAPAFGFTSDPDTGLYTAGSGSLVYTSNSTPEFLVTASGFLLGSSYLFRWGDGTDPVTSSPDLELSRAAARALTLGPTTGVTLRWATDGLLEVRNFANSAAGNLSALNYTSSGYVEGAEMTAPAAPAANGYRIYAEDNGAGKTRLMVLFASGAAQQIAIEP